MRYQIREEKKREEKKREEGFHGEKGITYEGTTGR
jgi:hypothetical protein